MHGASLTGRSQAGFTLVELLVATAILTLIIAMTAEVINVTSSATAASNRQIESSSMSRIALDRFGNDLDGMITLGGATAIYYSEPGPSGNSALGFISKSRARYTTTSAGSPSRPISHDIRGAIIGYKIRPVSIATSSGLVPVPTLSRGDGRFTFSIQSSSPRAAYRFPNIFAGRVSSGSTGRLPNDLVLVPSSSTDDKDERSVDWQGMAVGLLRMHISFVLDDGRIVQRPPGYNKFLAEDADRLDGFAAMKADGSYADHYSLPCIPIAFSRADSIDPQGRYVKGLIVGVAALDERTLKLCLLTDPDFVAKINSKLKRPTADGETPSTVWKTNLSAWNANSSDSSLMPLRQNIRFFQRYYSLSR